MPESESKDKFPVDANGKKLKPCCACPETKKVRDECIMEKVKNIKSIKKIMVISVSQF